MKSVKVSKKFGLKQIMIFCLLFLFSMQLHANIDTSLNSNTFNTSFSKLINIYNLNSEINLTNNTKFGVIEFNNLYDGNILGTLNKTFRDDAIQNFKYSYPIAERFKINVNQNWTYSADLRSQGSNQLQRLSGLAGLTYNDKIVNAKFLGGYENNEQIGIRSDGALILFNAELEEQDISGFRLRSTFDSEVLNLNYDRNNTRLNFTTNSVKYFNNNDVFRANASYKRFDRAYFSINDPLADLYEQVEERLENRYGANLALDYEVFSSSLLRLNLDFYSIGVIKENRSLTYDRLYNESNFSADAEITTPLLGGDWIFGLNYNNRDEDHIIEDRVQTPESELFAISQLENQKDNKSERTKVYTYGRYKLSSKDRLLISYSNSILRYDTPSNDNNDDRDQLSINGDLTYYRDFSEYMTFSLNANFRLIHLVFLKSQRSYLNNWNRIISLRPEIYYRTEQFNMRPRLQVMANYTVYDFEEFNSGVRSLSFRSLTYQDSINYNFTEKVSISSRIFYRYIETGTLFWKDFSELPQTGDLESQVKLLLEVKRKKNIVFGGGIRYYVKRIRALSDNISALNDYELISIGPETNINFEINDNTSLKITGWFEFQQINQTEFKQVPNLFINSMIKL